MFSTYHLLPKTLKHHQMNPFDSFQDPSIFISSDQLTAIKGGGVKEDDESETVVD